MEGNVAQVAEDICRTPPHDQCRIPAPSVCPAAPRKKPAMYVEQRVLSPKDGYYQSPDMEVFFAVALRREAASCVYF
ncbi:hypothetical protein F511_28862 [Dorcoceras hygrometricum]|uniref:Uncharacterized protein n=1 Tax=Dorcoceras hygrometricum TaxID=472368 RepID=A0A2Z7D3H5_9LAMI|nr:hypothetical protein F511_28862 [Dorcoceras hygrometricum]